MSKMSKEELIELVRQRELEIRVLKKEIKGQKVRWQSYYRDKSYRTNKRRINNNNKGGGEKL